jgi:hypothetical protein
MLIMLLDFNNVYSQLWCVNCFDVMESFACLCFSVCLFVCCLLACLFTCFLVYLFACCLFVCLSVRLFPCLLPPGIGQNTSASTLALMDIFGISTMLRYFNFTYLL